MARTKFGMIYEIASGELRIVVIPDDDAALVDHGSVQAGHAMHVEPIEMWRAGGPPNFLRDHIRKLHAAGRLARG